MAKKAETRVATFPPEVRTCILAIGNSELRRKVFEEVYRGKKPTKSAQSLADLLGWPLKRVLDNALPLVRSQVIGESSNASSSGKEYVKLDWVAPIKQKVLRYSSDSELVKATNRYIPVATHSTSHHTKNMKTTNINNSQIISLGDGNTVSADTLHQQINSSPNVQEQLQEELKDLLAKVKGLSNTSLRGRTESAIEDAQNALDSDEPTASKLLVRVYNGAKDLGIEVIGKTIVELIKGAIN